jgi:hypothetical protein
MSPGDGPSKPGDAGAATSAAALRAQYRATRARLLGSPPAEVQRLAPAARAAMRFARRSRPRWPGWLHDLIAFNEELRRLFLGGGATADLLAGERISAIVAAHYRVTTAEIESGGAIRRVAWPRQVAMYICARHAGLPSPQIGRLFGNRDQSTVRFAVAAVDRRVAVDPALAADIDRLVQTWRAKGHR